MTEKISFASDYMEGAHPNILKRLADTNWQKMPGYGFDEISLSAKERIRKACEAPNAEVEILIGGTQTNAIAGFLSRRDCRRYGTYQRA